MTLASIIVDRDPRYAEWLRHHLSVVYTDATLSVMDVRALRARPRNADAR